MGSPWINATGDVAHPDSPRGGGGPGFFGSPNPSGVTGGAPDDPPDPKSPAGLTTVLDDDDKKGIELDNKPADPKVVKTQDVLSADVTAGAEKLVGDPPIGTGECYDLVHKVLQAAGAKSAPDFGAITPDADYKWGTAIKMDDLQAGDVLQMRNHKWKSVTEIKTTTTPTAPGATPGEDVETKEDGPWSRPHHTAIIVDKNSDGSLVIVEQNLVDPATGSKYTTIQKSNLIVKASRTVTTSPPVMKNVPGLGPCKIETVTTVTITVSGTIWPYRPKAKN